MRTPRDIMTVNWRRRKRLYKRKYRSWRNGSDKALRTMRRVCNLPDPRWEFCK